MNRAQAKATSEVIANHICKQLERLVRFEMNPSKLRCGVKALTEYLHRTNVDFSRGGASDQVEPFFLPMFDAEGVLKEALCCKPLSHELVKLAITKLQRVRDQIETN